MEIQRQTAYIVKISDILTGKYVKSQKEFEPNYVLTVFGLEASRVNILGVVLDKIADANAETIVLDDGSGTIIIRIFEKNPFFEGFVLGDILLVVGKPREFNGEKYIVPEIMKKIQNLR